MKNLLALVLVASLTGCAGLTVQWTAVASYSTAEAAPVIHLPAVVAPASPAPAK